jgi:hypothetical protein
MNLESSELLFFLETDNTPLIIFSTTGKILYVNAAAEILLGYVKKQELYDIALSYAPKTFGSKTTQIKLNYDMFNFYAINVAYRDEEKIGLRLYNEPQGHSERRLNMEKYAHTDINTLLEANITLFRLQNSNPLSLLVDQELPKCRIDQNQFSKLLRKILESFRASDSINISLKMLIGEYIVLEEKREPLLQLLVEANGRYHDQDEEIRQIAKLSHISCLLKEHLIRLHIPFIQ